MYVYYCTSVQKQVSTDYLLFIPHGVYMVQGVLIWSNSVVVFSVTEMKERKKPTPIISLSVDIFLMRRPILFLSAVCLNKI